MEAGEPALRLDREHALAYRLSAHHLAARRPISLEEAAGACGVQDLPRGMAAVALAARVEGLDPTAYARALHEDRTLVETWSVRGATYVFPTADARVFTRGVLPREEEDLRQFIGRTATGHLDAAGIPAVDALERVAAAARDALDGRALTRDELHQEWRERLPEELLPWCKGCESNHVSPLIWRSVGARGDFVLGEPAGRSAVLVRTDQWLADAPRDERSDEEATTELVRRFMRCHAPATRAELTAWLGVSTAQGRRAWELIVAELAPVELEGARAFALAVDLERMAEPEVARGARLLPPSDPYLGQRNRATLVPDPALRKRLWTAIGAPGAALHDGRLAGLWRPRKRGKRLEVRLEPLGRLTRAVRGALEAEAQLIAPFRGAAEAQVVLEE